MNFDSYLPYSFLALTLEILYFSSPWNYWPSLGTLRSCSPSCQATFGLRYRLIGWSNSSERTNFLKEKTQARIQIEKAGSQWSKKTAFVLMVAKNSFTETLINASVEFSALAIDTSSSWLLLHSGCSLSLCEISEEAENSSLLLAKLLKTLAFGLKGSGLCLTKPQILCLAH